MTKPIISADSHVVEPPDCYIGRIDPKFRDRAPVMVHDEKRGDVFRIEGSEQRIPLSLVSAAGKPPEELTPLGAKFEKLHRGGWDPQARIEAQAEDGIAAELLYPSVGMELCNIPDLELKQACMEAYNRWLVEFCEPYPHRLIGLGQAAVRTPEEGIRELEVIRDQGFRGVMLPGLPGVEDYDDPMYGEFFDAIVDLGLVASFHILTSGEGMRQGFRGSKINGFMSIVRGNQDLMSMFVFDGIFMRHPKLRIVSVEADGGWVPHFMYRMDHAYRRHRHWLRGRELERMPSEYFREHVYFTFQDDHTAFRLKDHMNIERMMWANDYPHSDSTWPWSQDVLREQAAGLTAAEKDLVLHDNVARLYDLDTSAAPRRRLTTPCLSRPSGVARVRCKPGRRGAGRPRPVDQGQTASSASARCSRAMDHTSIPSCVRNDRLPPYEEHPPRHARQLRHRAEPREHSGVVARLGLDLDRHEFALPAKEEVDLGAVRGMRRPVVDLLVEVALLAVRPEKVKHPAFEERPAFLRGDRPSKPLDRTDEPRIDPVELRHGRRSRTLSLASKAGSRNASRVSSRMSR